MSGFFGKIKQAFGSKKVQKHKIYEGQEVKMMALKTRVILTESMEQQLRLITLQDQKFRFLSSDPGQYYAVLQVIGERVIEAESMKIFIEMMRKVENNSTNIARTNGDISLLKSELPWFQSVLWYRQCKQAGNLEDIYAFCLDFFKGVDITREMDITCEVFAIYPILKYLRRKEVLPLPEILFYLQPYVSCNIDKPTLDSIFALNQEDLRKQALNQPVTPQRKTQEPSRLYPSNSQINAPWQTNSSSIGLNTGNISSISPQGYNQYERPSHHSKQSQIGNTNNIPHNNSYLPGYYQQDSNPFQTQNNSFQPQNQNNSFIPQNNSFIPQNNSFIPQNHSFVPQNNNLAPQNNSFIPQNNSYIPQNNSFIPQNNTFIPQTNPPFAPQNSNYVPPSPNLPFYPDMKNSVDHNPFASTSKFQNTLNTNNTHNNPPVVQIKKQPQPKPQPIETSKKSFFNSLMRTNSQQKNSLDEPTFILPQPALNVNFDRERQQNDFHFAENNESQIPFNRDTYEQFGQKKQAEEAKKKAEEAAMAKQKEQERIRKEKEEQERAERQKQAKQQADRIERQRLQRQQQARKAKQQQQRKEKEQEQRQREREQRMREREREEERELDVFVDNQREAIDRGYSGRFSSNMGFKYDFEDQQAEEFASHADSLNSSLLRFKKEEPAEQHQQPSAATVTESVDCGQLDQQQSLRIIESSGGVGASGFKLFYYRKMVS